MLLLNLRSCVNAQTSEGCSAIYNAAQNNHKRVILLLASARASLDLVANSHTTPLYKSAECGNTDAVLALGELRASLDTPHNTGFTPIAIAAHSNQDEVVRLLGHLGARLTYTDAHDNAVRGFWMLYEDAKRTRMGEIWTSIIQAGGDLPSEESLRIRRRMMVRAKQHDPRDGSTSETPL